MRCQEAKQYIHSYLDGQLTETQQKILYQHLSACPSCQNEMNSARRLNELLEEACSPVEPPLHFTSMVMEKIPGAPEAVHPVRSVRKKIKKKSVVREWLHAVMDMETKVLLAASYLVIFAAIGILFVYGSSQLNGITPGDTGEQPPAIVDNSPQEQQGEEQQQEEVEPPEQSPGVTPSPVVQNRPPVTSGAPAGEEQPEEDVKVNVSPAVILTTMVTGQEVRNIHPVWDRDGNILYLSQRTPDENRYTLWKAKADGEDKSILSKGQLGLPIMQGGGVWSYDRAEIAYVTKRNGYLEIWADDLASGRGTNLTIDTTGKALERAQAGEDLWAYNPVWSAQGEIAFLTTRSDNVDIMAIDRDGINRVITRTPAVETNPAWSPDGKMIAYARSMVEEEGGTINQVYVVNQDGSNPQAVTSDFEAASLVPGWHPGGRYLAVNVGGVDSGSEKEQGIWLVDLDQKNAVQLTQVGGGDLISWSPDGRKIAFTDDNRVLYVLYINQDMSVGSLYQIMPETDGLTKVWVDWAKDSRELLFDWVRPESKQGIWKATLPEVVNPEN